MSPSILNKMFGHSPIIPVQEHMTKVYQCTEKLLPFFKAILKNDWKKARELQKEIAKLENDADDIKRDVRLHLPKRLFLPVSRTDILELLIHQDRVANKAKDIAGIMLGRKMQIPTTMADEMIKYVERSIDATKQAQKAISELDELLETGFRGSEVKLVKNMIHKLDQIEHDTDKIQIKLRSELFDIEKELPPVDVMFLYKIIDWIGDLADRAQQAGGQLHLLLAR